MFPSEPKVKEAPPVPVSMWLKRMSGVVGVVRVILVPPSAGPEVGLRLQELVILVHLAVKVMLPVTGWVKS